VSDKINMFSVTSHSDLLMAYNLHKKLQSFKAGDFYELF